MRLRWTGFVWLLFVCSSVTADASREGRQLQRLAEEFWQGALAANPVGATVMGDHRFDHLLADISPRGRARERVRLMRVREKVAAVPTAKLSPKDRINHSMLLEVIDADLASLECDSADWVVDPLRGPQTSLLNIPSYQPIDDPKNGVPTVRRWRAMGPYLDQHVANLRSGLKKDRVATQSQVQKVLQQLDELLEKPDEEWPLLKPLETAQSDWPPRASRGFEKRLRAAVKDIVRPAFTRYRTFLHDEVMPHARPGDRVGVRFVPNGDACYLAMIERHTSLTLSPREIHNIGQSEVARIMSEMRELGDKVLGTDKLPEILRNLRNDQKLYFETRDGVEDKAREALARAEAAMPRWFGVLPQASCSVVRMEAHEEKHSTIAYYRQPSIDGARPGSYYINTYAPETRPRYEAEALAFHEAVPGHHLQIAIAQELKGVPTFRKHRGTTAFVEGWALYTERLSDEMGLYSGDLDRIGMLSFEAWRACRLVVDTGMHALGWSRQQAIDFMLANSALAENNIINEVDRYITWPGQALAYKLGQLEILKLRELARQRAGNNFDIREFHDVVLKNGAVSLAVLRAVVEEHYSE